MCKALNIAAAAAIVGVFMAAGSQLGATAAGETDVAVMGPGKGVSFDFGAKHAVGYFMARNGACDLTVMLASAVGGEVSDDSPGTRLNVTVLPGSAARIDAAAGKTAEFVCQDSAKTMTARVVDRAQWTPAKP